eukprot:s645_g12.t1
MHACQGWRLGHGPSLCVAGVALGDVDLRFVRQAWHLWHAAGSCDALGPRDRRGTLRGRRAWRQLPSFRVASVALGDICFHFVWHAWHLRHWAASGGGLGRRWVPVTPRLFCVAGVALGDSCLRFVWQAWHLATWTFTLRGRPGTDAGSCNAVGSREPGLRGTFRGVALGDMDLHFAWQAWHFATLIFTLRGRRGTYGTQLAWCPGVPRNCAWQAWRLVTWTSIWQAWRSVTSTFALCGSTGDMDLHFV